MPLLHSNIVVIVVYNAVFLPLPPHHCFFSGKIHEQSKFTLSDHNVTTSLKHHCHAHLHYCMFLLIVTALDMHMHHANFCPFLMSARWMKILQNILA